MRTRTFDPDDPEFVQKVQHARVVVFSTACILASLLLISICVPLLLARLSRLRWALGSSVTRSRPGGGDRARRGCQPLLSW